MPPDKEQVSASPINLLMANLPAIISALLSKAFERVSDIRVVRARAADTPIAKALRTNRIDVVLLGSSKNHGTRDAVEILQSLRQSKQRARFLILTENPDHSQTIALLRAGASGIITSDELQFDLLCESIRRVHSGQAWASHELLQHLVASLSSPSSRTVTDLKGARLLTEREQEVLQLLAEGLSNAELATELKLSGHTVKNHLFRIYEKLGVSNRMEAVLYFLTPRRLPEQ